MERGCAGNNSLTAGTKRPEELVDGTSKGEWTGTKKTKKLHEYQVSGGGGGGLSRSRKRPYEYSDEHELDVPMAKLYKCNYWEDDPSYAKKLEFFGLELARDAAVENFLERAHRQFEAWMAARQQHLVPKADGSEHMGS